MTAVVKWSVRVVSLSLSLSHTQDGSFVRVWDGERGREEGDMAPLDRFWETLDFKCSAASAQRLHSVTQPAISPC